MKVGVLLAAGASARMGSPKALAVHRGQSYLVHGVRHLWTTCDIVIVVLGAHARVIQKSAENEFTALVEAGALTGDLHAARGHGARGLEVRFETNARWKDGMLSSARVGLAAALKSRPEALLVLPVDHPRVQSETVLEMGAVMTEALKAFGGGKGKGAGFAYALVPRHRHRRGHPLAMTPALARAIIADKAAENLGDAVRRHARLVGYLDVTDAGILVNQNTPER